MLKSISRPTLFTLIISSAVLVLSACSSQPNTTEPTVTAAKDMTLCPEKRPQVCTMIYKPVCAIDSKGQSKTYASDCNACATAEVTGFNNGECPE